MKVFIVFGIDINNLFSGYCVKAVDSQAAIAAVRGCLKKISGIKCC